MPLLCCRSNSILTSCTVEQYLYSFSMLVYNYWLSTNVHTHAVGDKLSAQDIRAGSEDDDSAESALSCSGELGQWQ